jgi:hypothetical protein
MNKKIFLKIPVLPKKKKKWEATVEFWPTEL